MLGIGVGMGIELELMQCWVSAFTLAGLDVFGAGAGGHGHIC